MSDALGRSGHETVVLSRGPGSPTGSRRTVTWTPDGNLGPWAAVVDGAGSVVNLAGESIAGGRWTASRKAAIRESRLLATRSLVAAMVTARQPPPVFVSASGQGYYGDCGDVEVTEEAPPGDDFLARVCVEWEAEALRAPDASRVVVLRNGLVLSADEGALPRMAAPFRLFGGGPAGSGRQFVSWIHWRDWVGMTLWAMRTPAVSGPLNACAPAALSNEQFSAAIGRALHRPSWLRAPALALRAALGEMADALLLTSTRMVPARALALGYQFQFPDAGGALDDLLGKRR